MRITKEQEAEARKCSGDADVWVNGLVVANLLDEIDDLRKDNLMLKRNAAVMMADKLGNIGMKK